ncbi:hypothetical protein AVEN_145715-1, partial [Araneus ventricosus]
MHEQIVFIGTDAPDPDPREKQMTFEGLSEDLWSLEKGFQILETIDCNEERIVVSKQGNKELLACYEIIL